MAKKEPGRPPGAANKGNTFPRNETAKFRATEGYKRTIETLKTELKMSEADIIHEALQQYAYRKNIDPAGFLYWVSKII